VTRAPTQAAEESKAATPPVVGDKAPDFTLNDLKGSQVSLGEQLKRGSVVIVVLRGYPGYQCPICTRQFGELVGKVKEFTDAKASVMFIYPGPATDLDKYAKEFIGKKTFPTSFQFLIDPDFKFTELYRLRWDAPKETAYPASFVVDADGAIRFAKVSHSHGDRASSDELLGALGKISK
jgi:peroxiredoxin